MPLTFPANASINTTYTYSGITWVFDGTSWVKNAGGVSLGNITAVSDQLNLSTGYLDLPAGTTAQRPGSVSAGMTRFNTTNNQLEYSNGTDWFGISALNLSAYPVELVVVAGGGAGAYPAEHQGGGGGSGGQVNYATANLVPGTTYTVTVGAGGAINSNTGPTITGGTSSVVNLALAFGVTATGGQTPIRQNAGPGGITSKIINGVQTNYSGGTGAGTNGAYDQSGGGGAGGGGNGANASTSNGGVGGPGLANPIAGSTAGFLSSGTYYLSGGGGGGSDGSGGSGTHGGGNGESDYTNNNATAGATNTGAGGGGAGGRWGASAGNNPKPGGSGVVVLRYLGGQRATGGNISTAGGYTYHTFISSDTLTA